ncbi:MAG: peptidoglycan DD-metalloendopeptidase family protein [Clostridiales bacterium]|nr:peptidoglycan DD-metalloendopeptidase family protein [Clostridiales bacterium]
MIKRFIKAVSLLLCLSCVIACVCFTPLASAEESLDDYQQQLAKLDKQIAANKSKLAEVKSDLKDSKSKYNALSNEIGQINDQISLIDSKITVLNNNITALQSSIEQTQTDIESTTNEIVLVQKQIDESNILMNATKEMLLSRLRENYMAGSSSTLEMLFTAKDLSTFFARKELVASVSDQDANLIKNLTDSINQLSDLTIELTNKKAALEEKKADLDKQNEDLISRQNDLEASLGEQKSKKATVSSKQQELSSVINELDKDSAEYQAAIKKQEAEREKLNAQIDAYIKAHASAVGDTPDASIVNDGKMMWPVRGSTKVTAGYPAYSNGTSHWGIDIVKTDGSTRGTPFVAAQGGKVIIAVGDGGWNSGFGNYCVIDHGDGKMTLYAHADRIQVSVGQVVSKGQQIGIIGATGNVTGPHLHFEVRIKNANGSVSRVNPLNYVSP